MLFVTAAPVDETDLRCLYFSRPLAVWRLPPEHLQRRDFAVTPVVGSKWQFHFASSQLPNWRRIRDRATAMLKIIPNGGREMTYRPKPSREINEGGGPGA